MSCLLFALLLVPPEADLLESRMIWDRAPHNAFTDLVRFRRQWFCTFREGKRHVSPDGAIRVLNSNNTRDWKSIAHLTADDADLRDPKFSITPKGELMIVAVAAWHDKQKHNGHTHQTFAWFSADGKKWSKRHAIGDPGFWLWRVTWHNGKAYSFGYRTNRQKRLVRLYVSDDGRTFKTLVKSAFTEGSPNECTIRFRGRGKQAEAVALLRREGKPNHAMLGVARAPFTKWTWTKLDRRIGGPNLVIDDQGRLFCVVRLYDGGARTEVCRIYPQKGMIDPLKKLPSGGDTSYAGLVLERDTLWISYYSSHERKSKIYLAKVRLAEK